MKYTRQKWSDMTLGLHTYMVSLVSAVYAISPLLTLLQYHLSTTKHNKQEHVGYRRRSNWIINILLRNVKINQLLHR